METVNEELNIDTNLENAIRSYSKHIESIRDKEIDMVLAFLKANYNNEMAKDIIKSVMEYIKLHNSHRFPDFGWSVKNAAKYTNKDLKEILGRIGELVRHDKNTRGNEGILDGLVLLMLDRQSIEDICTISNETGKTVDHLLRDVVTDWIMSKKAEMTKDE